jgi:hypothetical protein
MRIQSKEDMLLQGASQEEAEKALQLYNILLPALKHKTNGRFELNGGDKTILGMYRIIKEVLK